MHPYVLFRLLGGWSLQSIRRSPPGVPMWARNSRVARLPRPSLRRSASEHGARVYRAMRLMTSNSYRAPSARGPRAFGWGHSALRRHCGHRKPKARGARLSCAQVPDGGGGDEAESEATYWASTPQFRRHALQLVSVLSASVSQNPRSAEGSGAGGCVESAALTAVEPMVLP